MTSEEAVRERQRAKELASAGQLPEAEAILARVTSVAVSDEQAWHLLGLVRYRQRYFESAARAFRRRLELAPQNADAHYSLAITLVKLGVSDEALPLLRQAVRLKPNFAEAQQELANLETTRVQGGRSSTSTEVHPPLRAAESEGASIPSQSHEAPGVTKGLIRGIARNIKTTSVAHLLIRGMTTITLSFRIQRTDDPTLPQVQVQLTGEAIEGDLSEGDGVEVRGTVGASGVVKVAHVRNLNTQALVSARRSGFARATRGLVPLYALLLVAVAFGAFKLWSGNKSTAVPPEEIPSVRPELQEPAPNPTERAADPRPPTARDEEATRPPGPIDPPQVPGEEPKEPAAARPLRPDAGAQASREPQAAARVVPAGMQYVVQVAAARQRQEADDIERQLDSKGYEAFVVDPRPGAPAVFRVQVGPFLTRGDAELNNEKLRDDGFKGGWITHLGGQGKTGH